MTGNIALAGFVLTEDEWQAFEPATREHLLAVADRRDGVEVGSPGPDGPGQASRVRTTAHG